MPTTKQPRDLPEIPVTPGARRSVRSFGRPGRPGQDPPIVLDELPPEVAPCAVARPNRRGVASFDPARM